MKDDSNAATGGTSLAVTSLVPTASQVAVGAGISGASGAVSSGAVALATGDDVGKAMIEGGSMGFVDRRGRFETTEEDLSPRKTAVKNVGNTRFFPC